MQSIAKSLALAVLTVCFAAVAADAQAKRGRSSSSSSSKPSNSSSSKKHDEAAKKKQDDDAKELEAKKRREHEEARNDRGIHIDLGSRSRSQAQPPSGSAAATQGARPVSAPAVVSQPVASAAEPSPEERKRSEELAALQKRFEQETAARKAEADAKRAQEEARQAAAAEAERAQREEKLRVAQREAERKRHQEELQRQCVIKPVMTDSDIAKCRRASSNI